MKEFVSNKNSKYTLKYCYFPERSVIFYRIRKSSFWYEINRIINVTEWTYPNVYETGLSWENLQIPFMENKIFNAMKESLQGANGFQMFTSVTQIQYTNQYTTSELKSCKNIFWKLKKTEKKIVKKIELWQWSPYKP